MNIRFTMLVVGLALYFSPAGGLAAGNDEVVMSNPGANTLRVANWTEERRAAARAMPLIRIQRSPTATLGGAAPFVYTSYELFPDRVALYKQPTYRTVGKLFFHNPFDGFDYQCSASIVDAPNQDTVWTAGHCVYSPFLGFHTDFEFIPARRDGTAPFGSWSALRNSVVLTNWTNGLLEYDSGAVIFDVGGTGGTRHVGALGGLTFIANLNRDQHFHARGYPAAAPFGGEKHHICASSWVTNDQPGGTPGVDPETIGIGCDMTGGSSGGPWIVDWGTNNYLNSNVSYGYIGVPDEFYGPYFGDLAQVLYDFASTL